MLVIRQLACTGPDGERARADAIELIAGFNRRAVRDAISDRVQDDRHVLEGQAVHGSSGPW